MTINSVELKEYLSTLGITSNKTIKLEGIPEIILHSDYYMHFIRGYFDGDGSIYNKKEQIGINFTSSCFNLLNQIKFLLNLHTNKIADYKTYYGLNCAGIQKPISILDKLYKNSDVNNRLERKYQIYKQFKARNEVIH